MDAIVTPKLVCSGSREWALVTSLKTDATVLRMFNFGFQDQLPPRLCSRVCMTLVPTTVASVLPWYGFPLRPPGSAITVARGHVPHGQWALLDANMFELVDRSACLVELGGPLLL